MYKRQPYPVFYDYVYAGSLAVQGSEELCRRLMLWAHDRGWGLARHYCSLENKHRAQIRNLTEPYARINKCYAFDYDDFFLKTALDVYKRQPDSCASLPAKKAHERGGGHRLIARQVAGRA